MKTILADDIKTNVSLVGIHCSTFGISINTQKGYFLLFALVFVGDDEKRYFEFIMDISRKDIQISFL